jgi:hypothetical protein
MNDRRRHWDSAYKGREETEVSWFQETAEPSLGLILKHSRPDHAVIDIGAGASRLVDGLLDRGYSDITLVDISQIALDKTRRRLGAMATDISFLDVDVTAWAPQRAWDVWHDRAVFHFLVQDVDQAAYLAVMDKGTRPGSVVVLGTFALQGPEKCSGLPVRRYSARSLQNRIGAQYRLIEEVDHVHRTPVGREQAFTFAVFVRN